MVQLALFTQFVRTNRLLNFENRLQIGFLLNLNCITGHNILIIVVAAIRHKQWDYFENLQAVLNFFFALRRCLPQTFKGARLSWSERRPGATGGIPGPCPPKLGLCPEEINRFGALKRKSRPKLVFFVDLKLEKPLEFLEISFLKNHGNSLEISVKTFFLEFTCLRSEKPLKFPISARKSLEISVKTFFFGGHLISAGKTTWISDFGRKIPLNFRSTPCSFDPDRDKFLVPPWPFRIHTK